MATMISILEMLWNDRNSLLQFIRIRKSCGSKSAEEKKKYEQNSPLAKILVGRRENTK